MKFAVGLTSLLIMAIAIAGDGRGDKKIPLHSIYSSANCGIDKQTIRRVNSESELSQLLDLASSSFQPKPTIKIEVDYTKQSLIVVALGQKNTAGFHLILNADKAIIRGQKLYLPIRIVQPGQDSFQAQVITSPCEIFSIPRVEFTEILIESFSGDSSGDRGYRRVGSDQGH